MADNVLRSFLVSLSYKIAGGEERKFVDSLEKATLKANLLSAALIEAAKAVARAVADMATGFESLYYASQRTGASVQNLKAVSYAVSQLGGSYSGAFNSVEAFAKQMRANPGYGALVRSLGVATSLGGKVRDTVDVLGDLGKVFAGQRYEIGLAYASALGLDEATFRALRDQPEALKKYKEEYASFAKTVGLNNQEAAKNSEEFMQSLRSLGTFVTTVAEKLLSDLAPALKGVIDGFLAWAAAHPEQIHEILTKITDAAKWLGEQIKDLVLNGIDYFSQFQDKLAEWTKEGSVLDTLGKVASGIERIVKAITSAITWLHDLDRATEMKGLKDIASWLGWIDKKTDASAGLAGIGAVDQATSGYAGVNPSAEGQARGGGVWNRVKRFFGGGSSGGDVPDTGKRLRGGGAVSADQSAREQRAVARLIGLGWKPEAAATAIGQAVEESRVHSNGANGDGGSAQGMFQWRKERLENLKKFAEKRGKSWRDFDTQVDFFDAERKTRSSAEKNWHNETDFTRGNRTGYLFERYAGDIQGRREAHARRIFRDYQRIGQTPPPEEQTDKPISNPNVPKLNNYDFSRTMSVPPLANTTNDNSSSKSVMLNQKTEINVMGGSDPAATAAAVQGHQVGVNSASLRNAGTAIR